MTKGKEGGAEVSMSAVPRGLFTQPQGVEPEEAPSQGKEGGRRSRRTRGGGILLFSETLRSNQLGKTSAHGGRESLKLVPHRG